MKLKGSVTVFVVLIYLSLIFFIGAMISLATFYSTRENVKIKTYLANESILAEYVYPLYSMYGMYFIDPVNNLENNYDDEDLVRWIREYYDVDNKSLNDAKIVDVSLTNVIKAVDNNKKAVVKNIDEIMKFSILDIDLSMKNIQNDFIEQVNQVKLLRELNSYIESLNKVISDIDGVKMKKHSILSFLTPNINNVFLKKIAKRDELYILDSTIYNKVQKKLFDYEKYNIELKNLVEEYNDVELLITDDLSEEEIIEINSKLNNISKKIENKKNKYIKVFKELYEKSIDSLNDIQIAKLEVNKSIQKSNIRINELSSKKNNLSESTYNELLKVNNEFKNNLEKNEMNKLLDIEKAVIVYKDEISKAITTLRGNSLAKSTYDIYLNIPFYKMKFEYSTDSKIYKILNLLKINPIYLLDINTNQKTKIIDEKYLYNNIDENYKLLDLLENKEIDLKFDNIPFLEKVYIVEYILTYFKNYKTNKEIIDYNGEELKTVLNNEIEYILCGKKNDLSNIENVIYNFILVKSTMNYIKIHMDNEIMVKINTIVTGNPILTSVIREMAILLLAYEDSIISLKILLENGKINFFNDKIKIGFEEMLLFNKEMVKEKANKFNDGIGLDYKDCLRILLLIKSKNTLVNRIMDIVQENIRYNYDKNFLFKNAIYSFENNVEYAINSKFYIHFPNQKLKMKASY